MSYDDWNSVTGINLMGVVNGLFAAYASMTKQGYGYIVNTGSLAIAHRSALSRIKIRVIAGVLRRLPELVRLFTRLMASGLTRGTNST